MEDGVWRTVDETREALKAGKRETEEILRGDDFGMRTGEDAKALGRSPVAKLYQLAGTGLRAESSRVQFDFQGADEGNWTTGLDCKESSSSSRVHPYPSELDRDPSPVPVLSMP